MSRIVDLRKKPSTEKETIKPELAQQPLPQNVAPVISPAPVAVALPVTSPALQSLPQEEVTKITWSGPLLHHRPNMRLVAALAILLIVAAVGTFLLQHNGIASFLFILCDIVLLIHIRRDIEIVAFELNYIGIKVHNTLYPYRDIASFWIAYEPEYHIREISFHFKKHRPYLKIPLHDQDPVQAREFMLDFIPEIEHHEHAAHTLSRLLGI